MSSQTITSVTVTLDSNPTIIKTVTIVRRQRYFASRTVFASKDQIAIVPGLNLIPSVVGTKET
jgi:hypothetical protein